ncbi:LysR family transcriptional regulator [Agrobacterium sp. ES01]|uniref:LysR family transcriptional regulator n=1 Tax=Agrobacterium sp. ES01 TaxID=3420714 RepID=UPI003D1331B4
MDLRALRYFVAVVRARSISAAAEELHIAQPAVTRQLQKLEHELGAQLLERSGRGVQMTKAGFILMERAEALLRMADDTRDYISGTENLAVGNVVLGLPPMAGAALAPPIVEHYLKVWPQISLRLLEGSSPSLHEWVLDRRIDLAVLHNPVSLPELDVEPISYEQTVLIGPGKTAHGNLPRIKKSISVGDLVDIPLIMPALPHANRRMLDNAAKQFGVRLQIRSEVDSITLIKALIRYGQGFTVTTYASVQQEVERGELQAYFLDRPPLISVFAIVRRREMRGSWLTNELAQTVKTTLTQLIAAGQWQGSQRRGREDAEC